MSTFAIQFFIKLIFKFFKLNQFHIIKNKLTNYYIKVYTCYSNNTATNRSSIKIKQKLN